MAWIIWQMLQESGAADVRLVYDNTLDRPYFESAAEFHKDLVQLKASLPALSHFVACIGNEHGWARYKVAECLKQLGLSPLSLIHPKAYLDPTAVLGTGCIVLPMALAHKFTVLGDQCILNSACVIEHECTLGNGVHVMSHATLTGKVQVGNFATIGAHATILPGLKVGEGAIVGAGAVVTKNVPAYTVVIGNPARATRTHQPIFDSSILALLEQP